MKFAAELEESVDDHFSRIASAEQENEELWEKSVNLKAHVQTAHEEVQTEFEETIKAQVHAPPEVKIDFTSWIPEDYAAWVHEILEAPKGLTMSEQILRKKHGGIFVENFLKKPEATRQLYGLDTAC